ncbi:DUF6892 domain-containing protein [Catenuloplanes japonicus]|uniref:DUF6892 domain-containing protein n=1 Tax=Catenuloplanes japonicus TaxID=33876 RepID=UPI00052432A0|nr:hypothetical protein [Catenuloplanes japonicus]
MTIFADRGLHLGVLDTLLSNGGIAAADLRALVESTGPDGPDDGYPGPGPRLAASLALLHAVPIPPALAATVTEVDFDGSNDIYMLIEQTLDIDTGGESDDYNVASIEGIHLLPALLSLNLDGHGYHPDPLDLTPLAGHPALTTLMLTGACTAAGTLESLPALRNLDVGLARLDDPAVLPRLAARGVTVVSR